MEWKERLNDVVYFNNYTTDSEARSYEKVLIPFIQELLDKQRAEIDDLKEDIRIMSMMIDAKQPTN